MRAAWPRIGDRVRVAALRSRFDGRVGVVKRLGVYPNEWDVFVLLDGQSEPCWFADEELVKA